MLQWRGEGTDAVNRCPRDYKAEIERVRAHHQRAKTVLDALIVFFRFEQPDQYGFAFLGELMWIVQRDGQMIDRLIEKQTAERGEGGSDD